MWNLVQKWFQGDSEEGQIWRIDQCFACHEPIREGVIFPEDQASFCVRCFYSTPCFCCGLPCGKLHRRLSDDRILCQHCYSSALLTPRQLAPMYEATLKCFRRKLKMSLKDQPRLKVVDSRFMKKNFNCSPYTWGLYVHDGSEETIYVISGIAADKSLTTLAHELTHFWQRRHCPKKQSLEMSEGFAEWVAFQVAKQHHLRRAMLSLRRNEAEPYRTGLKKFLEIESQEGVRGTVKYATTHQTL